MNNDIFIYLTLQQLVPWKAERVKRFYFSAILFTNCPFYFPISWKESFLFYPVQKKLSFAYVSEGGLGL